MNGYGSVRLSALLTACVLTSVSPELCAGNASPSASAQAVATPSPQAQAALTTPSQQNMVTQGELLTLTKMVLDTSKEQSERAREHLNWFMSVIGVLAAILAFLGFREIKSIGAPYKEKLEALIAEFQERSHHNARALVSATVASNFLNQAEKLKQGEDDLGRQALFRAVTEHVDQALPEEYEKKLDPYLIGLLLMRKAYALKRLDRFAEAYDASVKGIELSGDKSNDLWRFNAACYAACNGNEMGCCKWLAEAIRLNPKNRSDAADVKETDFARVRDAPCFIALISSAT
jgi:hypothetical protein